MADIEVKARGARGIRPSLFWTGFAGIWPRSLREQTQMSPIRRRRVILRLLGLETFGQYAVQRVDGEVGRLDVNAQRRLGLQDVHVVTGGLDDHPELEHAVADRRRLFRRGFQGL